ncbi:MAG: hypothetical protein ACYDDF_02440 [Thermoplasmatota archaeon]
MTERKLKKKSKAEKGTEVKIDIAETFDVANAKDDLADLDIDSARYQGKKGQAGTRTKTTS